MLLGRVWRTARRASRVDRGPWPWPGGIGDITRFANAAKLARYTGCAPIPVYSSDKERHRLHRGGNRRLNSVLYTASIVQQRFHPEPENCWHAMSPPRAPAAPGASSSDT
ncbi:transposase [Kitasatospora sp. NPDC087314]|uniref:transposase n=1 Tax=Kitasatospora sp. NPDC087314 TaxID=3364068 RepID=UPI00382244D4